jgi:glucosamine--fructose-6-phosphate aminotransferase (isomerizing)
MVAMKLFENNVKHIFILGKGLALPIALESALKIKEISYVHAEGFSGGALKHGPFALLSDDIPIIFIILDDIHKEKMKVAVEEVAARCSNIITITNIPNIWSSYTKNMGEVILIPSNELLTALLAIIPIQLIAYELSILKGINPDRPRHLAKTVTVD